MAQCSLTPTMGKKQRHPEPDDGPSQTDADGKEIPRIDVPVAMWVSITVRFGQTVFLMTTSRTLITATPVDARERSSPDSALSRSSKSDDASAVSSYRESPRVSVLHLHDPRQKTHRQVHRQPRRQRHHRQRRTCRRRVFLGTPRRCPLYKNCQSTRTFA